MHSHSKKSELEKPFFTVLINAYNYGHYIEEAILSVIQQTLPRDQFEVIVVDDGSTDDTAERVTRYGDSVSYIYQENAGQAAAFNAGIANAKGEFVAFLDADDVWCRDKLEYIKNFIAVNNNVDMIYHSLIQVDESGNLLSTNPRFIIDEVIQNPLTAFLNGTLSGGVPTSGITCKLQLLRQLSPFPLGYRICADSYLMITAPLIANSIGYIAHPLTYYRLHPKNNYNRFDTSAGRYVNRDEKALLEKLKLDIHSLEFMASKLNIDMKEYYADTKYHLAVQEALSIRREQSLVKAFIFMIGSMRGQKSVNNGKLIYRFTSVAFRLIFGSEIFNAFARHYTGSRLHALVHSYINSRQGRPAHE